MRTLIVILLSVVLLSSSVVYNSVFRVDKVLGAFVDTLQTEFQFNKNKAHGFFAFEDSAVVIDCTKDTWVPITNATGNLFQEIQTNQGFIRSGDTFTYNQFFRPDFHPHIEIDYKADGTAGNNKIFSLRIFNITQNYGVVAKTTTKAGINDQIVLIGFAYDREAQFGDKYVMQIMNKSDNTNFTVVDASIKFNISHY